MAKCVAAVCASAGADATAGNVTKLIKQLEKSSGGEQLLALLCLGRGLHSSTCRLVVSNFCVVWW